MKRLLPVIMICFTLLGACKSVDFFEPPAALAPGDFQQDWTVFREALTAFHPGLTAYHSREVVDRFLDAQEGRINQAMDYRRFYALLSETADFIGDGHTGVFHPEWYWENLPEGWFPLELFPSRNRLYVMAPDAPLPRGSRITEIEGRRTEDILEELKIYTTGDGYPNPYETDLLAYGFSDYYTGHFGSREEYRISWIEPDTKEEKSGVFPAWFPSEEDEGEEYFPEPPRAYEFTPLDDTRAYLAVDSFEFSEEEGYEVTAEDYSEFLKSSFTELKKGRYRELILDLRRNGGGDPLLLAELLSYLIPEDFLLDRMMFARTQEIPLKEYILPSQKPLAAEVERELKEMTEPDGRGFYAYRRDSGEYEVKVIPEEELLFSGNLKVLVSYSSFSAAGMCAALLEDRTEAVTIGQETSGGYARLCAAADFDYRLPSTGIQVSIPTVGIMVNIKNRKYPPGRGTIPDVMVEDRIGPLLEGLDPELEAALAL